MRYVIGFLISIGVIVLVFILVLRGLGGDAPKQTPTPLIDYSNTSTTVRLTVDGPIISQEQHRAYQVTVGQYQSKIDTYQGYEYNVIASRSYVNNQEGYANFLRALDIAGFTKGVDNSKNEDERGVCASGDRYTMEILDGATRIQRYWSAECKGQGTFKGNTPQVRQLFNKQIPTAEFNKLTGSLNL